MPTHGSVAKAVRLRKEAHPEEYCPIFGCLWRTGYSAASGAPLGRPRNTPCRKHEHWPAYKAEMAKRTPEAVK